MPLSPSQRLTLGQFPLVACCTPSCNSTLQKKRKRAALNLPGGARKIRDVVLAISKAVLCNPKKKKEEWLWPARNLGEIKLIY